MISAAGICDEADLTYRRVDYWTRKGYLHTTEPERDQFGPCNGSGYPREYPDDQLAIAQQMSRLTKAGLTPGAAHATAVELLANDGTARLGGFLIVDVPVTQPLEGAS